MRQQERKEKGKERERQTKEIELEHTEGIDTESVWVETKNEMTEKVVIKLEVK
jgi:hypothetical protein